VRRFVRCRSLG